MHPQTVSISTASPRSWPGGSRQTALLRPAAVAVHHQRDVAGHEFGLQDRAGVAPEGCGSGGRITRSAAGSSGVRGSRRRITVSILPHGQASTSTAACGAANARSAATCAIDARDATAGVPRPVRWPASAASRAPSSVPSHSPRSRASIKSSTPGDGVAAPAGRQWHADRSACGDMECTVRSRSAAAGALVEGGRPTRITHGSQQERVEHELDRPRLLGDRTQRSRPSIAAAAAPAPVPRRPTARRFRVPRRPWCTGCSRRRCQWRTHRPSAPE